MKWLISTVFALVIFFLILSFYYLQGDRKAARKEKLLKKLAAERRSPQDDRVLNEKSGFMETMLGRVMDIAIIESLLISAEASISVKRFLFVSFGIGLFFVLPPLLLMRNPFIMFLFLMLGFFCPAFYYIYRRNKREEGLVKQLPEAIDMIIRSLKAGQSLDGALREVGRKLPAPVGTEIRSVYDEIAMGLSFETAIRNFADRYPRIADIKILCTTFAVQRETGGNISAGEHNRSSSPSPSSSHACTLTTPEVSADRSKSGDG